MMMKIINRLNMNSNIIPDIVNIMLRDEYS